MMSKFVNYISLGHLRRDGVCLVRPGYPWFLEANLFLPWLIFLASEVSPRESRFAANLFWLLGYFLYHCLETFVAFGFRHPTGMVSHGYSWIAGIPDGRIEGKPTIFAISLAKISKKCSSNPDLKGSSVKVTHRYTICQQVLRRRKCDCVFVIDTIQKCFSLRLWCHLSGKLVMIVPKSGK